jgi:hypothetical protein
VKQTVFANGASSVTTNFLSRKVDSVTGNADVAHFYQYDLYPCRVANYSFLIFLHPTYRQGVRQGVRPYLIASFWLHFSLVVGASTGLCRANCALVIPERSITS